MTLGRKRQLVQWGATLVVLLLPLCQWNGKSLFRLDVGSRTLLCFGGELRIVEFHLLLLAVLLLVFAFLLMTMVLGRVWCGWLCPQTTLSDLEEWIERRVISCIHTRALRLAARQLSCAAIACVVACNLLWYFIPPGTFFRRLLSGQIGAAAGITLATVVLVVHLDLALVRRLFCKAVCPYGRLQFATMDKSTLTLAFDPALRERCIRCAACEACCPMGIDIKDGQQIECINCGRCLDACRRTMAARGEEGLISYRFGAGETNHGRRSMAWPLIGVILLISCLLALGIASRKEATLKVQHATQVMTKRLPDGTRVNFYTAYVENRGTREERFTLTVPPVAGYRIEILGPVRDFTVAANGDRRIDFAVQVSPEPARKELELRLVRRGRTVAQTVLPFLHAP